MSAMTNFATGEINLSFEILWNWRKDNVSDSFWWRLIYLSTEHKIEMSLVAAESNWNPVYAHSKGIIPLWQGRINDHHFIIAEIPYFCLETKFVFNILIKFFLYNLRPMFCPTTNHYCCSTRWYWSMTVSAFFEISMKWPLIIFIFCNDCRMWGFGQCETTSNEKCSLIRWWNRVSKITP